MESLSKSTSDYRGCSRFPCSTEPMSGRDEHEPTSRVDMFSSHEQLARSETIEARNQGCYNFSKTFPELWTLMDQVFVSVLAGGPAYVLSFVA